MSSPLYIVSRAFRVWWQEVVVLLVLNAVWFVLQIPVITGPPATAVVYAMARRSLDGEYWNLRDAWRAYRDLFWPAWRWALLNLTVWIAGIWNLVAYWQAPEAPWFGLRLLWIMSLTVWMSMNLFYWPFWLVQEDRSTLNTLRNCGRFLLLHPAIAVTLTIFCFSLAVISLILTIPFTLALMCWLALIGVIAVEESLQKQLSGQEKQQPSHQDQRYDTGH